MTDLKTIVQKRWEEIDANRETNEVSKLSPEVIRTYLQTEIMRRESLSRWIGSSEELETLTDQFLRIMPQKEVIGSVGVFAGHILHFGEQMILRYGIPIKKEVLRHGEFAQYGDYRPLGSDQPQEELRVLPDRASTKEIIGRSMNLYQRMQTDSALGEIMGGFDSWRAALVFAQYAHRWSRKTSENSGKPYPPRLMAYKNAKRYQRFGLTSEESLKAVKPGALYHVENVFGEFGVCYIAGNLEKFKELSLYSQSKDAKRYFNDVSQGNYEKFRQVIAGKKV